MGARRSHANPRASSAIVRASQALTQLYDGELRGVGLTTPQYTVLQTLATVGIVTRSRLGQILLLDSALLSRRLRPLVKRRWVRTRMGRNGPDRHLELTSAGRAKLERATPAWNRAQDRVVAQIGEERLNALMVELTVIAKLARRL